MTDALGQKLSGGDQVFRFHRLFGDADGDRDVDRTDLALFKQSLNRPKYVWYFDYDNDGLVNQSDLLQIKLRMNRTVL